MSDDTVDPAGDPLQQLFADQLADQRRVAADFNEQFAANRARLAGALDDARAAQRKATADPTIGELVQLLNAHPALVQPTLNFAKQLLVRVQNAVNAELSKAVSILEPPPAN